MRAIEILQDKLGDSLGFLHSKRLTALWRVVDALLKGQELRLTELGRNLPGQCSIKHRVKAVDRFIGSPAIQAATVHIYAVLARFLLRTIERPIILVDWTGAEPGFYVLSAKLAFEGRALTILSRAYAAKMKATPAAESAFLTELKEIVPSHCRPVLVTDAGFLFKWVDSVRAIGWDYVGRARLKKMLVTIGDRIMPLREAYKLAQQNHRDLGGVTLGKGNPRQHRAVLSARPKSKGRKHLNRKGRHRMSATAKCARDAAREPLFLITSLGDAPRIVVDIYRMRMQIEQTFRDLKSHRYGWSTKLIRTKTQSRMDVMLLVAAIAAMAMHLVGLSIRHSKIAHGFQANTERRRAVFSTFFLGKLALHEGIEKRLPECVFRTAMRTLIATLRSVERLTA